MNEEMRLERLEKVYRLLCSEDPVNVRLGFQLGNSIGYNDRAIISWCWRKKKVRVDGDWYKRGYSELSLGWCKLVRLDKEGRGYPPVWKVYYYALVVNSPLVSRDKTPHHRLSPDFHKRTKAIAELIIKMKEGPC